jgi:hypothetical protein
MPSIRGIKANLNPTVFAQGVIHCVVAMIKKYNLTMVELCGVLQTFDYVSDVSCYLISACVFTLKFVSKSNRKVGLEFGYDLQDLIYHIYKHQGRSGKEMPAHQYNRYVNRQVDCHNTKQEFKQQAFFRLIVGMMCHAYRADQPRSKKKFKEIYNKILLLFNKHAKQCGPLVGDNRLVCLDYIWIISSVVPNIPCLTCKDGQS